MKKIQDVQIRDKNVLVRIDADVPLISQKSKVPSGIKSQNATIVDDSRLQASIPTLKYLLENGAKVTIIGHLDRPGGKVVEGLKMRPVEDKLIELIGTHQNWQILENLRFSPGEEKNEPDFARQLAAGQDIFVQDAFAVCHRVHASIVGVAKLLPSCVGFSVQKEVEGLSKLLENPARPLVVIIGGAKIEDKKPVIQGLLNNADQILVGGVVANELQKEKEKLSKKVVLPIDGQPDISGFDIGPKTIELFKKIITRAKTIFWAGPMGKYEKPEYETGTKEVTRAIASSSAFTAVGGGNTIEALKKFGFSDRVKFISVGGGAALEYLAGRKLPGLEILK